MAAALSPLCSLSRGLTAVDRGQWGSAWVDVDEGLHGSVGILRGIGGGRDRSGTRIAPWVDRGNGGRKERGQL